jgi:large subunit ribosomal protein L25
MAQSTLSARVREAKGKGAANKLRRDRQIPAVLYGPNISPVMLSVSEPDLKTVLKSATGENIVLGLQIDTGNGSDTKNVILKELQADPIKPIYYHADFYEISMDRELTFDIPIHLVNTPVGVANGGILQHVKREVSVSCLPGDLVDYLEVDVSALDIGGSIHVKDLVFPKGVRSLEDAEMTLAVLNAPAAVVEKVEEEVKEEVKEGGEAAAPAEKASEGGESAR